MDSLMDKLPEGMRQSPPNSSEIIESLIRESDFLEKFNEDLLEKIRKINKRCWVNGEECLYGSPCGKFAEAPLDACKGCHVFGNYAEEMEYLLDFEQIVADLRFMQDLLNKSAKKVCDEKSFEVLRELINKISCRLKLDD